MRGEGGYSRVPKKWDFMGLGIVGEGGGVGEGVMSRQVTSLDYHMYQGLINSLHILFF